MKGHASEAAQIKYLMALQKVHMDQLATLKLEVKATDLNHAIERLEWEKKLGALRTECGDLLNLKDPGPRPITPVKKPWWKFWRKK